MLPSEIVPMKLYGLFRQVMERSMFYGGVSDKVKVTTLHHATAYQRFVCFQRDHQDNKRGTNGIFSSEMNKNI